jgi:hypothetical protein
VGTEWDWTFELRKGPLLWLLQVSGEARISTDRKTVRKVTLYRYEWPLEERRVGLIEFVHWQSFYFSGNYCVHAPSLCQQRMAAAFCDVTFYSEKNQRTHIFTERIKHAFVRTDYSRS